jgi:tryptophanyl-tRNA synthetase
LKQWVQLQEEYECYFLIADIQALTTHLSEPFLIEKSVREVVLDWIGVGLDPERENVHFVLQSNVPELTELTTYFTMLVPFVDMERNPTIRTERARLDAAPSAGFMIYPISQAADILLFTPFPPTEGDELLVPVGEDQVPHLEGTNRIARVFNRQYGRVFLECKPKVGEVGRLPGTDGKEKMSKSIDNVILLKDDPDTVRQMVKKMFTDPEKIRQGDPGHPDRCPVFLYHQSFGDRNHAEERIQGCSQGSLGCVECKKDLAEALNIFLEPIRSRRSKIVESSLGDFLDEGSKKAKEIGVKTLEIVRKKMHLDYPSIFKRGG